MADFDKAHAFTLKWEGGLTRDKADKGGTTNFGVSLAFLTDFAKNSSNKAFLTKIGVSTPVTEAAIVKLTQWQGAQIFRRYFWDHIKLDDYAQRPATLLYDMRVNHGPVWGIKLCQRGYNAARPGGTIALDADGLMGPKTRAALINFSTDAFVKAAVEARRAYYRAIVKNNPTQKVFLKGWLNRANDLEKFLLESPA